MIGNRLQGYTIGTTRRNFIMGGLAGIASAAVPASAKAATRVGPGRLWVIRMDNGEQLDAPYAMHSKAADRNAWIIWSHFWRDVRDRDQAVWIDRHLLLMLNRIQMALSQEKGQDVPLHLTSGYRTVERNATLEGAAPNSLHTRGMAGDISAPGFTPSQLATLAEALGHHGGLGRYSGFTHLDTGRNRRWGSN
jgi:Uncharacterized protein conserved in bacteria